MLYDTNFILTVIFIGLVGYAAYTDLVELKIQNKICLAIAALWPAHLMATTQYVDWRSALAIAGITFTVGIVLFAFRKIGGGDVKMFAAVALWANTPDTALIFVIVSTIVGVSYGLIMLSPYKFHVAYAFDRMGLNSVYNTMASRSIPFGVGIAAGGIFVIAPTLLN